MKVTKVKYYTAASFTGIPGSKVVHLDSLGVRGNFFDIFDSLWRKKVKNCCSKELSLSVEHKKFAQTFDRHNLGYSK